ncbi:efflux RND transporter permease subunit [bacterium]|nr:efflux RND transporter permease subunit [bacterium]
MWDNIIKYSLNNKKIVFLATIIIVIVGINRLKNMRVDALPEITAPTVTIVSSCEGMQPEEIERFVTLPIEQSINGSPNLRRVRGKSSFGLSIVTAEFDWGSDSFKVRQSVFERVQLVKDRLNSIGVEPEIAPMSSITGEIIVFGIYGDRVHLRELRDIAEWNIIPQILSISGVAQVTPIGGEEKELQIILKPEKLEFYKISPNEIVEKLEDVNRNYEGALINWGYQEYIVTGKGRFSNLDKFSNFIISFDLNGLPIYLKDIASIEFGSKISRGAGGINGKNAVLLIVQKQNNADTIKVLKNIDKVLKELKNSLPKEITLFTDGFRQDTFIERGLNNIKTHLIESSILIIVIIFLFLGNIKTTLISLITIPISLFISIIVLDFLGMSINTMTLGGFAIAIGSIVDDAIIDVENVYRRLKNGDFIEKTYIERVLEASIEIRNSIVYATIIVVIVFLPLFFLNGLEGILIKPLGVAYVIAILSSLVTALTITPALSSVLLKNIAISNSKSDNFVTSFLKKRYIQSLKLLIKMRYPTIILSLIVSIISLYILFSFGRDFMPKFNEGSFTISLSLTPGISLDESNRAFSSFEKKISSLNFVKSVVRRMGRSDARDEHGHEIYTSSMDILIKPELISNLEAEKIFRKILKDSGEFSGVVTQPLTYRIAHLNTGSEASIVLKIFGDNLDLLKELAEDVKTIISKISGVVDVRIEPQHKTPSISIYPKESGLINYQISSKEIPFFTKLAFQGIKIGDWRDNQKSYDITLKYPDSYKESLFSIKETPYILNDKSSVPLKFIAEIKEEMIYHIVMHENGNRRVQITANINNRDGKSVIEDIQREIKNSINFPIGYRVSYDGDFENERRAFNTILSLSIVVFVLMFFLLYSLFSSIKDSFIILINIPLSIIGGVIALYYMNGIITIATLVGFITLFGISVRNGILLVSHYHRLIFEEKVDFWDAIYRGSSERLIPILMTALATAFALIPISMSFGEAGSEIQAPMAIVILGGLLSSTFLNIFIVPLIYSLKKSNSIKNRKSI